MLFIGIACIIIAGGIDRVDVLPIGEVHRCGILEHIIILGDGAQLAALGSNRILRGHYHERAVVGLPLGIDGVEKALFLIEVLIDIVLFDGGIKPFGQQRIACAVVAHGVVVVPDGAAEANGGFCVGGLIVILAGDVGIDIFGDLLDDILSGQRGKIEIFVIILAALRADAVLGEDCVLKLLEVVCNIVHLRAGGIFRLLDDHRLPAVGNKAAGLGGIAVGMIQLQKIAAGDILGVIGDLIALAAARNRGVGRAEGGIILQIQLVDLLGGIL